MSTFVLVSQGTVTAGEGQFTSFVETPQAGEEGMVIRFGGRTYQDVRRYCIKKASMPALPSVVTTDWAVAAGSDITIWHPTVFIPIDKYVIGGTTFLYFPEDVPLPATQQWRIYRQFQ